MCGICGVVGWPDAGAAVERMLDRLKHRGPDSSGLWVARGPDSGVSLGQARLAIVDLSPAGNQPMTNEDQTLWLVGNGEIYNAPELRADLEKRGHCFRSHSDNEVLLHLYEEEGENFLPRLNGMEALAIWDRTRQRLLLARDRLGIKPLYYFLGPQCLAFASEIKALFGEPQVSRGIDLVGLKQYLTYANTFGPVTLHRDIHMVEPGQYLVWENGRLHQGFFWQPDFSRSVTPKFEDACQAYLQVLEKSVSRHLMSDVEVASYLSSGFDSTTVTTVASRYVTGPLATYTGAFRSKNWYDETEGAGSVAAKVGTRHHVVEIGPNDLKEHLDDLVYALDEPRMGLGAFPQYMVAKAAAQRVKVILTGHGGDEFFAGYPVFKLIHLWKSFQNGLLNGAPALKTIRKEEWPHLVYFLMRILAGRKSAVFLPVLFPETMLARGLRPEVYDRLKDIRPEDGLENLLGNKTDPYHRLTLTYLRAYLPGLFVVEDKISMAHSLESRTPLCDNELVELALSWPLSIKLHQGTLKAIPKTAMKDRLPQALYRQPKRGFPTPLASWLRGDLAGWTRERLLGPDSRLERLFQADFLKQLVEDFLGSWRGLVRPLDEIPTHRMWALLSLEAWLRLSEDRLQVHLGWE